MKALALILALALLPLAAAPADAKPKRAKCAAVKKKPRKCARPKKKVRLSSQAYTSLLGAPAGFSTPAPFATAGRPAPAAPTPETPEEPVTPPTLPPVYSNPRAVQVQAFEFGLQLSKATVLSGNVRVEFNSMRAEDPHDLRLLRESTLYAFDEQGPGSVTAKTVSLSPGKWKLFCSLPEHEELGMKATLTVTAG